MSIVAVGFVLVGAGLTTTLLAELSGGKELVYVAKPVASLGFLLVALGSGALDSDYGVWILVGLILSMVGDVALMFEGKAFFLSGLVSFLLGHVAYIVAFLLLGVAASWALGALAGAILFAWPVLTWLLPHVEAAMKAPVLGYVAVISLMIGLAVGTRGAGSTPLIAAGAALFYFSDLFVARDRFVVPSFTNELVGLPLYYSGQVLLALSVGA